MKRKGWKQVERNVAEYLGGKRIPITGRERGDVPDVKAEGLAVEVKERAVGGYPQWLKEAMEQAVMSARVGDIPIVFLHEYGNEYDGDMVVLRACDFRALHGMRMIYQSEDPKAVAEYFSLFIDKHGLEALMDALEWYLKGEGENGEK